MTPRRTAGATPRPGPRRVVAFGGGTGLPAVLRGLRGLVRRELLDDVTAVVTMTDDGGSSGRLRRTRGLPPPGDLRNCLVALAADEHLMASLFQHRYGGSEELGGHTVGNLIIAALAEKTGCFLEAVEQSSRVLGVVGRILPATLESVTLEASMGDGTTLGGETRIAGSRAGIRQVRLNPTPVPPTPGVLQAVRDADLVVLGPGSLYTSTIPNLLVDGIAASLRDTRAVVVLVANIVNEPGESPGLHLGDHLRVIEEHAGGRFVDAVVVHEGPLDAVVLERYRADGALPLDAAELAAYPVRVVRRDVVAPGEKIRHDPEQTAEALLEAWRDVTAKRFREQVG